MVTSTDSFRPSRFQILAVVLTTAFFIHPRAAEGQTDPPGEQTFQTICIACHTVGGGPLVGPDLFGLEQRRSEEWIIGFVQSSQAMVNAGDPDAVAVFEEYNRVVMPDNLLTDDGVRSVLDYMRTSSESGVVLSLAPAAPLGPATANQIALGQELFQGKTRFMNGGPTCNACHDVTNDAVIGGGVLAVELTSVFTRLGGAGVRAILGSPPFPVMQQAYADRPLTEEEVAALVGFLQEADDQQSLQQPRDYGVRLFVAGLLGAAILLGIYTLIWSGRKGGSVNQAIFDRQVTST